MATFRDRDGPGQCQRSVRGRRGGRRRNLVTCAPEDLLAFGEQLFQILIWPARTRTRGKPLSAAALARPWARALFLSTRGRASPHIGRSTPTAFALPACTRNKYLTNWNRFVTKSWVFRHEPCPCHHRNTSDCPWRCPATEPIVAHTPRSMCLRCCWKGGVVTTEPRRSINQSRVRNFLGQGRRWLRRRAQRVLRSRRR